MKSALMFLFLFLCLIPSPENRCEMSPSLIRLYLNNSTYITASRPPLNYVQDGKLEGIMVETLALVLKKLNSTKTINEIKVYPWVRGYNFLQNKPNTILFGMVKTKEREHLFKFAGPVCSTDITVFALKKKKIIIRSLNDLKKYNIGVVHNEICNLYLQDHGFTNKQLTVVPEPETVAKLLSTESIDAWAYGSVIAAKTLNEMGYDLSQYEKIFTANAGNVYFAFHKGTPDDVVSGFQKVLDEVKKSSDFKHILRKYSNFEKKYLRIK